MKETFDALKKEIDNAADQALPYDSFSQIMTLGTISLIGSSITHYENLNKLTEDEAKELRGHRSLVVDRINNLPLV